MSIIENLLSSEGMKKRLFSMLAEGARKNGIKKLMIEIKDAGDFETVVLKESDIIISKETLDFLKSFYEKNAKLLLIEKTT